jgi:hypothetical protein
MIKKNALVFAVFTAVISLSVPAWAQNPPATQTATATDNVMYGGTYGTNTLGGSGYGWANGNATATDPNKASVNLAGAGAGNTTFGTIPNGVNSAATSSVSMAGNTLGAGPNTLTVSGGASQSNAANVPTGTDTSNFAGGSSWSLGGFDGSVTQKGDFSGNGAGAAVGNSSATVTHWP